MTKHVVFFTSLLAFIFIAEGVVFLMSIIPSYEAGFRGWAMYSLFLVLVHFFIAYGLIKRKKWAPHLGIFFQLYIIINFIFNNPSTITLTVLLPSLLTVLSVSAFLTVSLFILRDEFVN